jgi:hypothetical protein
MSDDGQASEGEAEQGLTLPELRQGRVFEQDRQKDSRLLAVAEA